MKHLHILSLAAMMLFGIDAAVAQTTETFDFTGAQVNGSTIENSTSVDGTTISGTNVTLLFEKNGGNTAPAYYTTGTAIRMYGSNTLTIATTSSSYIITNIAFTFASSTYAPTSSNSSVSSGSFDYDSYTWTGTASSVILTNTATSGNFRVQKVEVTYEESTTNQVDAALAFSATSETISEDDIESYVSPTFTYSTTAEITFASDNTDVATVSTDGVVSLTGERGTAIITATSEANDDYYAGSATYTVTVYGYKTYTKTSTIVSGSEYLIVVQDGTNTYYAYPISSTSTYGYLYVGTVSGSVDEISVKTSYEDGFIIESVDDGYSIKDVDTERYYCQSGTYKSFQISSDAAAWTIELQDDGTFKISMNDYYIQYSTSYTSFGIYTDEQGLLPYLYVLGDGTSNSVKPEVNAATDNKVYRSAGSLVVEAAEGSTIEVYDLAGSKIAQVVATQSVTTIDGIAQGQLLIVSIDGRAQKILF